MKAIETDFRELKVTPGPVTLPDGARLSIDSLTSDLIAEPRARAILDREAPGLTTSPRQGMFPQTRLRNLKPEFPQLLTDAALERIEKELEGLR
jgi:hypothetical protein